MTNIAYQPFLSLPPVVWDAVRQRLHFGAIGRGTGILNVSRVSDEQRKKNLALEM